jgi:uncharacterized protein DUF4149
MTNVRRFVRVFALGAWVGSTFYFTAAVAPAAFRVLTNPDQAVALLMFTLGRLRLVGVVAAALYLLATMGLSQSLIAVIVMLLLTIISQQFVMRKMQVLRMQMGSVAATSTSDPPRVQFDRLRDVSADIEGALLLIGLAALFLTVRKYRL